MAARCRQSSGATG